VALATLDGTISHVVLGGALEFGTAHKVEMFVAKHHGYRKGNLV
jgi:hypothetical protein